MKCRSLFSGKNKKNSDCHLLKFFSILSINTILKYFVTNIEKPIGLKYHNTVSFGYLKL